MQPVVKQSEFEDCDMKDLSLLVASIRRIKLLNVPISDREKDFYLSRLNKKDSIDLLKCILGIKKPNKIQKEVIDNLQILALGKTLI